MRKIPATMATQHPDNASAPYWEKDGDSFVSVQEELKEAVSCLDDLGTEEFMWDWEGKYADEAVIDKLFSRHHQYFKKNPLGKKKFLTFRLPNVWKEPGYSLIRALMVILTSEDFASDLRFASRPLFEVILPMTERADQLMYIQHSFQKLARFKSKTFDHQKTTNSDYVEVIPLVEGVQSQLGIKKLLETYAEEHKKYFRAKPAYVRPFLARSDPALISGLIPTVLANKIALSDIAEFSKETNIPTYPIIGVGSLIFRGGLTPNNPHKFLAEYSGVRTVTIQSAFRYDFPTQEVRQAILYLNKNIHHTQTVNIPKKDRRLLLGIIKKSAAIYQSTVARILKDMQPIFQAVPNRRERRQHIGLLGYGRSMGKFYLPRAINFTAAMYSMGVPPEIVGLGRILESLSQTELSALKKYYVYFAADIEQCGRFLNKNNIKLLAKKNSAWSLIDKDVLQAEKILQIKLGPKTHYELLNENLTSQLFLQKQDLKAVGALIHQTGILRKSLG